MKIRRAWMALLISLSMLGTDLLGGTVLGQEEGKTGGTGVSQGPEWLSGSGENLQVRLRGKVLDKNGEPATGFKISATRHSVFSRPIFEPQVHGSEFDVWVPVNDSDWYWLDIEAVSSDGGQSVCKRLLRHELREAAVGGLTLSMQAPSRKVEVTVTDQGKPVPDAQVLAELKQGSTKQVQTDPSGVARLGLLPNQKLLRLHAWTDDFRIGGYSFNKKPARNPNADQHVIELTSCRKQEIRFLDEENAPVANLEFLINVATPPPFYNFLGTDPNSHMLTDDQGKAFYQWFPDWKNAFYYVTINDKQWIKAAREEMVDGTIVVNLKKSQWENRKQMVGQVNSPNGTPGGFLVSLDSFQGEEEHRCDVLFAFTDSTGKFSCSVLPNATYCEFVNDACWVSNAIDGIPYESATQKNTSPTLTLTKGTKVEVVLTEGPDKKPIANQSVYLRTPHEYSWREEGRTRHGSGGRGWNVTTDDQGKTTIFVQTGKLEGHVYMEDWTSEKTIEVKEDGSSKLEFHRAINTKRKVTGQLVLAAGVEASLANAEIEIGSVDGETSEQNLIVSNKNGAFQFETKASQIGVFAYTKDAKAAGMAIVDNLESPIQLKLFPTRDYHGRVLGKDDKPLLNHSVRARIYVSGTGDSACGHKKSFEAKRIETTTDQEGNYTIKGVPTEAKVHIFADAIDDSEYDVRIGEIYLVPDETRPRAVSRLAKRSSRSTKKTLKQRFDAMLRDCRLSGYRLIAIISNPAAKSFVDTHFMDRERNQDIYRFMQLRVPVSEKGFLLGDIEFIKQKNWPSPDEGRFSHTCSMAVAMNSERSKFLLVTMAPLKKPPLSSPSTLQSERMPSRNGTMLLLKQNGPIEKSGSESARDIAAPVLLFLGGLTNTTKR